MPAKPKEMTYATVCSGIECMSAAVAPLGGWKPVFFSEIEPFPCSLLKHRYPMVPNLGDMTKITAERIGDEEKWRITNGTDVIELAGRLGCLAGGTPCQDVSVAGKRAGMAEGSGTRSSLAFHFARLCRELQPRWVLWENVPGVLTSNGGRDFAHFVKSIGECGYSLAYRTLDAQWVRVDGLPRAVPQRRRRVWLVGHLGDSWRTPAEILFEPQGVRGDTPPRRIAGQGFTRSPGNGAHGADRPVPMNSNGGDVMPALTARDLEARITGQADRSGGYVMQPSGIDPYEPGGVKSDSPEVSGALVNGSSPGFHNAVCFENHQTDARTQEVDVAPTMGATHNAQAANNNPLVVVSTDVFGKVAHAVDKAGTGEKYAKIEVAETRNTFSNSEARTQEVVVQPKGGVVAIDMDKNKPTNADKPVRKGGAGFGVSEKGAQKKLLQAYRAQPIIATKLCTSADLSDFKENERFRLTDIGDLKPVGADGEIKDGGVSEEKAVNQLDTYAKKFCLTRKMIINDDLGAFLKVPAAMGNRAARLVDQLFFTRLLANPTMTDGKPLFSTNHRNLLTGANSALSADSLKKAIKAFLDQTDADGQPISVEPSILLVPTALKFLAQELTQGPTLVMSGGAENVIRPSVNVLANEGLSIVSSPYLSNSKYAGASDTAWYLFGKPGTVDTFEIGYLKGKRTPTVERGDLDFNVLGIWFRVYFDVGIREQDHRGMLKANGAAA